MEHFVTPRDLCVANGISVRSVAEKLIDEGTRIDFEDSFSDNEETFEVFAGALLSKIREAGYPVSTEVDHINGSGCNPLLPVVISMVFSRYIEGLNRSGIRQMSQTIGDTSSQVTYSLAWENGIYLTDDEWNILSAYHGDRNRKRRAGSVSLIPQQTSYGDPSGINSPFSV